LLNKKAHRPRAVKGRKPRDQRMKIRSRPMSRRNEKAASVEATP
jgi:hypothetical protein